MNIASHLVEMANKRGEADALLTDLRSVRGKIVYQCTSYARLNEKADWLARGFASLGVEKGSRVALCLKPGVDFFAVTFGLFKLGAVVVLIDPGIGLRNFGRCLGQAKPSVFVGIPAAHLLRRVLGWARGTLRVNVSSGWFGGRSLAAVEEMGRKLPAREMVEDGGDAAILFTSGSTGPAKGVMYTHENFTGQIEALKGTYGILPGEMDLATFPLFGLFGPALGMTTVIPEMDFTRPGFVDARKIVEPIQQLGITNMFGSPALVDRVSRYGELHGVKLPSLRRVISAGAPASGRVLARFSKMLSEGVEIFTPYGATEALPVSSIGSGEILRETSAMTDAGKGVCVGRPVETIRARVIGITDEVIGKWSDDLELGVGEVGEIVVSGKVVTSGYFERDAATRLAKIVGPDGEVMHRMGDVGYFDAAGRLWFCGRKSQRVRLPEGDMYSAPVEGIFNAHLAVKRTALVGVIRNGVTIPVVCVERLKWEKSDKKMRIAPNDFVVRELLALAKQYPLTRSIKDFLFHPRFPVDIRHNAKINREQLTIWAQREFS